MLNVYDRIAGFLCYLQLKIKTYKKVKIYMKDEHL